MDHYIDQKLCNECHLCIETCPNNIISLNSHNEVYFIPERLNICIKCGHCMAMCSKKAIHIEGLSYGRNFFQLPEHSPNPEYFTNFLATRRSIRNFKDTPVSKKVLEEILDSVTFAPYGARPDKMHITVINSRKTIESALPYISEFLDNIVKWIEHPIASRLIKRRNSSETYNTIKNHLYPIAKLQNYKLEYGDRITRGAPVLIILHADKKVEEHTNNSLIMATYMMLAAHSHGLGATLMGIIPNAINKVEKVRDIFKIPPEHEAVMALVLGHPKYRFQRGIQKRDHNIHWIK